MHNDLCDLAANEGSESVRFQANNNNSNNNKPEMKARQSIIIL